MNIMNQEVSIRILTAIRRIAATHPDRLFIVTALFMISACRLSPASWTNEFDHFLGRSGDTVLAITLVLMVVLYLIVKRVSPESKQPTALESAEIILETHLHLDREIDNKLNEVIGDTERSALAIIGQIRQLYDTANRLVSYVDGSSSKANQIRSEIAESMAYLVDISNFISKLPEKTERDMQSVKDVTCEINELGGLVEAVQSIAMQSHLLAINAAIEASRAGPAGLAFRIVADEVRSLAANSGAVAERIKLGLGRARHVVEGSMASSISESTQQMKQISQADASILKMQKNFEDMRHYYESRFAAIAKHNEELAKDIAEVLGQIQYQDVVRQCVERIQFAIVKRNCAFKEALVVNGHGQIDFTTLPSLLDLILQEYVMEENKHVHSARHNDESVDELKIELF